MNKLSDFELSYQIARHIGYAEKQLREMRSADEGGNEAVLGIFFKEDKSMRLFSIKDPTVIWPLCVKYDAFPFQSAGTPGMWMATSGKGNGVHTYKGNSPERAAAEAVLAYLRSTGSKIN